MFILSARRAPPGSSACAFANVVLTDDVAAFNVKITDRDGKLGAYAPNANGVRVVTFTPALAAEIAAAAIAYIDGGVCADDRTQH